MTVTSVFPCLRVSSRTLIDFYVEAFGAELVASHPESGEQVQHAELRLGDAAFMCGTEPGVIGQPLGGSCTYWVLRGDDEVDALYARALAAGATEVVAPHDPPYGGRQCALRDADGNAWSFGSYRGAAPD